MGYIARLDSSGHLKLEWDPEDRAQVRAARNTFDSYKAEGMALFEMNEDETQGDKMTDFDPEVAGIIAVPRMTGG